MPLQGLGMSCKEVSPRRKMHAELSCQLSLGFPVEIDHDVSAEDDVELIGEGKIRVHEVETPETDLRSQFRPYAYKTLSVTFAPEEVFLLEGYRNRLDFFMLVDRLSRFLKHLRGNIGRKNRKIDRETFRKLAQDHRQCIRLLTGRAARTPDAYTAAMFRKFRQYFFQQQVEMGSIRERNPFCWW